MTNPQTLYDEFESLLGATREAPLQSFLEKHPEIIFYTFNEGAQYPVVFPKFRLAEEFIPDFVMVAHRSGAAWDVNLIEIEPAVLTEKLFNNQRQSTGRLRIAEGQITNWQVWIESHEDFFRRRLLDRILEEHVWDESPFFRDATIANVGFFVWYRIIIGRRKHFDRWGNQYRTNFWRNSGKRVEIVTWDRLLDKTKQFSFLIDAK